MLDSPLCIAPVSARQDLAGLATCIRTEHRAVGLATTNMLEHALRAGDALLAAKQQVAEGGWELWVRKHCDLSLRCAQVYMQLAAARPQIEAQAQHAAPHSLRAALKLIGPAPKTSSRSHRTASKTKSNTAGKTRPATSFDALGWWSGAGPEARQHFLNGVGFSALRTAIPANWDLEGRMLRAVSNAKLLAAPSTPDEARTEVIERMQAGESVPVEEIKRTIDAAKGHKPRNFERAKIHRTMKLGADIIAKIKGTSLDNARELDELVFLNRCASEGELTDIVKELVEAAAAGRTVSAAFYKDCGAAFRREALRPANSGESARAAAAERIRDLGGRPNKVDADPEGASGNTSDEQARLRHFEFQNIALRSEVEELKAQIRGLEDRGLRPLEKLVDELERRLPAALPKKHLAALKALRGALGGHHLGPTLNLNPVADGEVTKH
jgi:hypothetical protein